MNCREFEEQMEEYLDPEGSPGEKGRWEEHLESCTRCRSVLKDAQALRVEAAALSRTLEPSRDLWPDILRRLEAETGSTEHPLSTEGPAMAKHEVLGLPRSRALGSRWPSGWAGSLRQVPLRWAMAAVLLLAGAGGVRLFTQAGRPFCEVASLEGSPRVGSQRVDVAQAAKLKIGDWLVTDRSSRALIAVGTIGRVQVEPASRVRLLETGESEHRLELDRGRLRAVISAPPRIFFIETPSAVAVDLGCAYTLEVDEQRAGKLHVTLGWAAFEHKGRESIVPAGALCETRPGTGPGTPHFEDAPEGLQQALARYDFEGGEPEALRTVLEAARPRDTLTLWHLLARVEVGERETVFERMAALIAPPKGVSRADILRLDKDALDLWWNALEPIWMGWKSARG